MSDQVQVSRCRVLALAHLILVHGAWALFLVSLFLPAVIVDMGPWIKQDTEPSLGIACAIIDDRYWASNIAMLLAPGISFLLRWFLPYRWLAALVGLFFAGTFLFIAAMYCQRGLFLQVFPGFVLWALSVALMAIGFFAGAVRPDERMHDQPPEHIA